MAAAAPGHHRVHRLGRGHVVVGLQRLRHPVALDPELGKEFLTFARRGVPAAHALTLSPCGRHTTCTECVPFIATIGACQTWASAAPPTRPGSGSFPAGGGPHPRPATRLA